MKIAYIANHDSGGNDDEGAVYAALTAYGHEVVRLRERVAGPDNVAKVCRGADFLLFHKWDYPETLATVKIPKVCWYWDLVQSRDSTLIRRDAQRQDWWRRMTSLIDLAFCSDGAWVQQLKTRAIHFFQGADGRFVGTGVRPSACSKCGEPGQEHYDVLFAGIGRGGGVRRESFVRELREMYGSGLLYLEQGVHQRRLADAIGTAKMVVAPDFPVFDDYWSNRVYLVMGFAAFVLHPYSPLLATHYRDGEEIVFYRSREDLHQKIASYRNRPEERRRIAENGFRRTVHEHLYSHRCYKLVQIVKEELCLS